MTRKLEETLGIEPNAAFSSNIDEIRKALAEENDKADEAADEAEFLSHELTPMVTQALADISEREHRVEELIDLAEFDTDTDEIYDQAMLAFKDTFSTAGNSEPHAAGRMYEAAANFMKIALDAKNSKVKGRLDAIDLALKKRRLDQNEAKKSDEDPMDADSKFIDRNEILKTFREAAIAAEKANSATTLPKPTKGSTKK